MTHSPEKRFSGRVLRYHTRGIRKKFPLLLLRQAKKKSLLLPQKLKFSIVEE